MTNVTPGLEIKRRGLGAVLGAVGFMLSPLSWWNDLFVNVPLALAFAWVASCLYRGAFTASFVLGYWLTNVLGFVLMHRGAEMTFAKDLKSYSTRQIARDVIISLLYTALIIILIETGVLAPLPDYIARLH